MSSYGVFKYSTEGIKTIFTGFMPYRLQFSVLLDSDAVLQIAFVAIPAFARQRMHRAAFSFPEEAAMISIFPFLGTCSTSIIAAATAIGDRYGPFFFPVADAAVFLEAADVIVDEYFFCLFVEFFVFRFDRLLGHRILSHRIVEQLILPFPIPIPEANFQRCLFDRVSCTP